MGYTAEDFFSNVLLVATLARYLDKNSLRRLASISRTCRAECRRRLVRSFPIHFSHPQWVWIAREGRLWEFIEHPSMLIFDDMCPTPSPENDFDRIQNMRRFLEGGPGPQQNELFFSTMFEGTYEKITHLKMTVEVTRFWTLAPTIAKMSNLKILHLKFTGVLVDHPRFIYLPQEIRHIYHVSYPSITDRGDVILPLIPVPGRHFPKLTFPSVTELGLNVWDYVSQPFRRSHLQVKLHMFYACFPNLKTIYTEGCLDSAELVYEHNKLYGTKYESETPLSWARQHKRLYSNYWRFHRYV
jgi:hypothetical protein